MISRREFFRIGGLSFIGLTFLPSIGSSPGSTIKRTRLPHVIVGSPRRGCSGSIANWEYRELMGKGIDDLCDFV